MAGVAALLLALTLGAEAQVDAGVRLEATARRLDPPDVSGEERSLDLIASPRVALRVAAGEATLRASYFPRFSARGVGRDARAEQMHEGELRLELTRGAPFRLEAFGAAAAGRTDLVSEIQSGTTPGTGASTILRTEQIDLERLRAGGSLSLAPSRRLELLLSGAVGRDGGTDARSREIHPPARTLESRAELRWRATRLDQVGLQLSGTQARIAMLRADAAWANALATWRHRLSPRTEAWSGAGAVAMTSRVPDPDATGTARTSSGRVAPAAQLGIQRTGSEPLDATVAVSGELGATMDRVTGRATPGVDARASLRWPWSRVVALTGTGAGALTWGEAGRIRTGHLELGASFTLTRRLQLGLAGFGTWQRAEGPAAARVESYGATLGLSLEAPPLRP